MDNEQGTLKALLSSVGERELKNFDGEICFGANGYYQENYVKNYFKEPIFVLDAFNKVYRIDPEDAKYNNSIRNKILLRSRGSIAQFNTNRDEHELHDSIGGDIIIHKHMFDDDGVMIIPECSLMISFNETELKYRLNNNPEVISLESRSDFIDKLLLKAFNQSNRPFDILILDCENILPDDLYTIINDEITTIPVIKNTPDESKIRIFIRKSKTQTDVYNFELSDLESDDGFKAGNSVFYINHSKDQINRIYKEKYPNSQIGERLVYEEKLSLSAKESNEKIDKLMTKYEKVVCDKDDQELLVIQKNLEIKKLKIKLNEMISSAQGQMWFEKKFGDTYLEAKNFVLKNNEMDHDQSKIVNEMDLMKKKNEASEIKNKHDIATAEQREISAGLKRHGDAVIMEEKIKHEKIKTTSTIAKSMGDIFKRVVL